MLKMYFESLKWYSRKLSKNMKIFVFIAFHQKTSCSLVFLGILQDLHMFLYFKAMSNKIFLSIRNDKHRFNTYRFSEIKKNSVTRKLLHVWLHLFMNRETLLNFRFKFYVTNVATNLIFTFFFCFLFNWKF